MSVKQNEAQIDNQSKIFFAVFFTAVLVCIGKIFITIEVNEDFRQFTLEDEIPESFQFYKDAYSQVMNKL